MRTPVRLLVPLATLGLALAAVPAVAGPPSLPDVAKGKGKKTEQPAASAAPFDYIAQAPRLSQPTYTDLITEVFTIPAHDGEQLYMEVTRPNPETYGEDFPVILEASPYHGTVADRQGTRMFPDPTDAEGNKEGLTGYFAQRGYAVAMMDLRGTGRSTGCLDHLGPDDQKDLKTVVEHLADAEWSTGKVGMTGHSYVGSTPSAAAAQNPRGLATIVPSAGLASMYDHQFNKGVPWLLQYIGPMVAYDGLALSRDLPGFLPPIPVVGGPNGDNFDENGPNPQTGCGLPNSAVFAGTGQVTGQYEAWHAERDSSRGAAAADIPVFMIHGANDNAARIPAAEWFFGGRFDRAQDKVWIGQWDHGSTNGRCGDESGARALHPTCRFDQMQYAIHAWFDKHLKGLDVSTGPAVEAFLNGERPVDITAVSDPETWGTKVVTDNAWSRPTSRMTLYPDASDGSLRLTPPTESASTSFDGGVNALLLGVNNGKAVFTSEPFAKDTVFLGLPELVLRASQSVAQVNHLTASLYRVDGEDRELANVCAIQPMLRYGVATIAPVVPGEAMDLPMQCFTAAHWVKAGQSLVLEISTRTQHHASFASDPQITVFTGPGASRYALPTVPDAVLHDDIPLREASAGDGSAPAPEGPAQPGESGSVLVPVGAVGERVEGVTAAGYEFTAQEGFDNAKLEVLATPDTPADLDLYLQRRNADGSWSEDLAEAATGSTTGETLTVGRLEPGEYRVLVVNWLGVATTAALELTFYDTAGVAGGTATAQVSEVQGRHLLLP
ncbi:MAG TPA: CocE/NonD family hydrolase [Mycobacteriales bacterium]|nr:CocE/NonD family hydrolase [Mycobacteriales bacterium]